MLWLCVVQGVFEVSKERGLLLVEVGEGVGVEDVRAATQTGATFQVSPCTLYTHCGGLIFCLYTCTGV